MNAELGYIAESVLAKIQDDKEKFKAEKMKPLFLLSSLLGPNGEPANVYDETKNEKVIATKKP